MKVRLVDDNILIKHLNADENKTDGGILLVNNDPTKVDVKAEVVAIGPGRLTQSGLRCPLDVEEGDEIIIHRGVGFPGPTTYLKIEGGEYRLIKEKDIIVILDKE